MSKFADLSEYDASELNEAVDRSNFPRSDSIVSYGSGHENGTFKLTNGTNNGSLKNLHDNNNHVDNDDVVSEESDEVRELVRSPAGTSTTQSGFMRRPHPTPLKMRGQSDEKFDIPGTPKTPRTATTPGNLYITPFLSCKVVVQTKKII